MLRSLTLPAYCVSLLLTFSACLVDGSVIDQLPCDCAPGFVCVTASDRCVPAGEGPDPDLGDCLAGEPDGFGEAELDLERWGTTTDNEAEIRIEQVLAESAGEETPEPVDGFRLE